MRFFTFFLLDLVLRLPGLFRGNAARRALRRIVRRLASADPRFLAHSGDSGRGIDNTTPWYHRYLTADLTPDLEEIVTSAARDAGYELHTEQERRQVNPTSSYLVGKNRGRTLTARITRDGEVAIYASGQGITWGQKHGPPAGKAILSLHMSLSPIR
jgi:hypothetical protein